MTTTPTSPALSHKADVTQRHFKEILTVDIAANLTYGNF